MTAARVAGDAASVSALASHLARSAAASRDAATVVELVARGLPGWHGEARASFDDSCRRASVAATCSADALEDCVRTLQDHVVHLQEAQALARQAVAHCQRHGLAVTAEGEPALPWGPGSLERAHELQERLAEARRLASRATASAEEAAARLPGRLAAPLVALRSAADRLRR